MIARRALPLLLAGAPAMAQPAPQPAPLGQPGVSEPGLLRGTAAYRERMALPPGAVLEVRLEDISLADAPSKLLAEAKLVTERQVPIPFALAYDPARIIENHTYAVRGTITVDGKPWFRTDTIHPVLTRGGAQEASLMLVRAADTTVAAPAGKPLVGTDWIAEDIERRGVVDRSRTSITLGADGRAYGLGGCNRWNGGYTLEGEKLFFGVAASTMMACPPPLAEQEQRFHRTLALIRRWRIEGDILHLLGEDGATLMRLAAAG